MSLHLFPTPIRHQKPTLKNTIAPCGATLSVGIMSWMFLYGAHTMRYVETLERVGVPATFTDPKGILATVLFIILGGTGMLGAYLTKKWADELWEHLNM